MRFPDWELGIIPDEIRRVLLRARSPLTLAVNNFNKQRLHSATGPQASAALLNRAVPPLGFFDYGTGMRYRFRCIVVFT
jgi:hypothetical protein